MTFEDAKLPIYPHKTCTPNWLKMVFTRGADIESESRAAQDPALNSPLRRPRGDKDIL